MSALIASVQICLLMLCLTFAQLQAQETTPSPELSMSQEKAQKLARKYYRNNRKDSCFFWAKQSIVLAKKMKAPSLAAASRKILGLAYIKFQQQENALKVFRQNLAYYRRIGDRLHEGIHLHNIGITFFYLSKYPQALVHYKQGLAILEELDLPKRIAPVLGSIANLYKALGNYKKAIDYHLQALHIREKINDKKGLARSYNNLGVLEKRLKNTKKAVFYYEKALKLKIALKDERGQALVLNNLGVIYTKTESLPKVIQHYQRILAINKKIKNHEGYAANLHNLGALYKKQGNYTQAIDYYQQAIVAWEAIGYRNYLSNSFYSLALVYHKQKNFALTKKYAQKSLNLAKLVGAKKLAARALKILYKTYYTNAQYKEAFDTQTLYMTYKDSLLNTAKVKQIAKLRAIYETEKKQDSIVLLSRENKIKDLNIAGQRNSLQLQQTALELLQKNKDLQEISFRQAQQKKDADLQKIALEKDKQNNEIKFLEKKEQLQASKLQNTKLEKRNLLISGSIAILLLVLVAGWLFITQRQRTRLAKEKLKRQNVISQFEYLKHQVNPHFLLNSLNALASLIQQDSKKAHKFALQFSQLYLFVLELKDNLMVSLEDELKFCEAYLALQQIRFGKHLKIDYQINMDKSKASLPPLALQIALENAVKHNQISAQAPLHIRIFAEAKKLVVQNNLQKKASHIVNSTHIGVQNIKERYKLIGKEQPEFIESTTDFTVKLPLSS